MPMSSSEVLGFSAAAVTLGGRPILRDIDLSIDAGEVVAVLGANGSGKSTLVKAAVGLRPLSSGEVRLFGTPLARFADWRRIGYVPQRSPMTAGVPATVAEVVGSGRVARRRPFLPAGRADRAAIASALEAVGLAGRARHPVSTLSGGQQQRVLMARALAGEPEVLILDEPNAGVDLVSQDAIVATLAELVAAGATVVVVLHGLGPFTSMVQRSVHLSEGRVVYDGPPNRVAIDPLGHIGHHCFPIEQELAVPDVVRPLEKGPLG